MGSPQASRGFVAVVPPPDVLDAIDEVVDGLALPDGARRADRAKLHCTIRFFGNRVDFPAVEAMLRGLDLRGGRARLGGGGAFPRARRGDVLWIGLTEGAEVLDALNTAVETGYAADRPEDVPPPRFHPHLTVARFRRPADLRSTVRAIGAGAVGPAWDVDELVLFRSRLGRGPAVYEEEARIPLAG